MARKRTTTASPRKANERASKRVKDKATADAAKEEEDQEKAEKRNPFGLEWSREGNMLVLDFPAGNHGAAAAGAKGKAATRIASFDLDTTLIKTKSGRVFANGPSDWQFFHEDIPAKLRALHEEGTQLVIFTNQNGIAKGKVTVQGFHGKVLSIIKEVGVPMRAFVATHDDLYRKPAVDMWTAMTSRLGPIDMDGSVYVGDAAGRAKAWDGNKKTKKDFSASDRKFAANVGVAFHTPEEYFMDGEVADFEWGGVDPASIPMADAKADKWEDSGKAAEQELIVFVGAPASGKSSFAKAHFVSKGYAYVNRDTLKTKSKCLKVTRESLANGQSVVVDNTNPGANTRGEYLAIAKKAGVPARCFWFKTSLEAAKHLNAFREKVDGIKHVPRIAYAMFKKNFQAPLKKEGFVEIQEIEFLASFNCEQRKKMFLQWT